MGGITRLGRQHPQLVRFKRSLASCGFAVLVPEVPEWQELQVAPHLTIPTIRAGIAAMRDRPEVSQGKIGLVGFSFGAPMIVLASTFDDLADHIAGVALFGGYCDLDRTLTCSLTGVHEWEGVTHRLSPDPVGRWVLASNYLTGVPGLEDATDVADALHRLARVAGDTRVRGWHPQHDALKRELRLEIAPERRELYDVFSRPSTDAPPSDAECASVARSLADAVRRAEPLLDPVRHLSRVRTPITLIHGRGDRLVPYTESLRFHACLPEAVESDVTITGLFEHSAGLSPSSLSARVRESVVFLQAMRRVLSTV
jgi:pimeloyl-ACP methyl ester carboxylesterase